MTTNRRYSLPELRGMKHKELVEVAKPLGVKVTKNVNKTDAIKRIMAAYATADVDTPEPLRSVAEPMPDNPDFESLVRDTDTDAADVPHAEMRGGTRPGAGRPLGMTAKKAKLANLPNQPHELVLMAVNAAFDLWAAKAQIPELALTKQEAFDLALPYTRLAEFYGVTKWLPEEIMLWVTPVWATYNVMKIKRSIVIQVKGGKADGAASVHHDDLRQTRQREDDEGPRTDSGQQPRVVL